MKKFKLLPILLSLCLTFSLSACGEKGGAPEPSVLSGDKLVSQSVRWLGRTEYSDGEVNLYYTATGFTVKFTGTRVDVKFKAENAASENKRPYFIASIDGEVAPAGKRFSVTQSEQKITVAENLPHGTHTVTVLKESEPEHGLTSVTEISTDGDFGIMPERSGLKFQILGGSGISGHGCLGSIGDEWTTENSSSLNGFGYLAARMFGAECQFVANSGMGLVWGYRNVAPLTAAYEATGLVAEYGSDGATSSVKAKGAWNHESWKPDAVIVNIGGNDYNSHINLLSGDARTQAERVFKDTVKTLLIRIHTLYPQAKVVWTCNSTTSGNGELAANAVAELDDGAFVAFATLLPEKHGADNHADRATQIANAARVAECLNTQFGFNPIRNNIKNN